MERNYYTVDSIKKLGLEVKDGKLKVYQDKLYVLLQSQTGKPEVAYLSKKLYPQFELKEQVMPSNLVISRIAPEDKDAYFLLTLKSSNPQVGDKVRIKGNGNITYTIAFVNKRKVVVTHPSWGRKYGAGEIPLPVKVYNTSDIVG